jgi:hypothetical protein
VNEEKSSSHSAKRKTCIYFFCGRNSGVQSHIFLPSETDKEVMPMLSKCANPSCSTPLVYLREGKIFMMEASQPKAAANASSPATPKTPSRVEHFWLCGPCSAGMTLAYDRQHGVQVVPKKYRALAAAS